MTKTLPTIERHKELGALLKKARNDLFSIGVELGRHYPNRISSLASKAGQCIDKLRSALDSEVCKVSGDNKDTTSVYYPTDGKELMLISGQDFLSGSIYPDRLTKRLSFDKKGVTIDGDYFIEKTRIDTGEKLLCWVIHLLGKSWVDAEFMNYFIKRVASKYNINVYDL